VLITEPYTEHMFWKMCVWAAASGRGDSHRPCRGGRVALSDRRGRDAMCVFIGETQATRNVRWRAAGCVVALSDESAHGALGRVNLAGLWLAEVEPSCRLGSPALGVAGCRARCAPSSGCPNPELWWRASPHPTQLLPRLPLYRGACVKGSNWG
jgi:hypothetical protein